MDAPPIVIKYIAESRLMYCALVDFQGNYTYINRLFEERFSRGPINLAEAHVRDHIHPEDWEKAEIAIHTCLGSIHQTAQCDLRKPHPDGGYIWTRWEFRLVLQDGEPEQILCLGFDVTEEQLLLAQLEQTLDSIADGFYTLNDRWEFTRINKTFEDLLNVKRADILGKKIWDCFPDLKDTVLEKGMLRALSGKRRVEVEAFYPHINRWVEARIYKSLDGLAIYFLDVTERKKFLRDLMQRNTRLKEIAHMQSHRLRHSLANILGLLELMQDEPLEGSAQTKLNYLLEEAHNMDDYIHILIQKSQIS